MKHHLTPRKLAWALMLTLCSCTYHPYAFSTDARPNPHNTAIVASGKSEVSGGLNVMATPIHTIHKSLGTITLLDSTVSGNPSYTLDSSAQFNKSYVTGHLNFEIASKPVWLNEIYAIAGASAATNAGHYDLDGRLGLGLQQYKSKFNLMFAWGWDLDHSYVAQNYIGIFDVQYGESYSLDTTAFLLLSNNMGVELHYSYAWTDLISLGYNGTLYEYTGAGIAPSSWNLTQSAAATFGTTVQCTLGVFWSIDHYNSLGQTNAAGLLVEMSKNL